jgi:sigma-B regulation protein RsbU (phosphoserine phosphatase)
MALGVMEEEVWSQGSVRLHPGDVLLLYTDGIIDAQNQEGAFFGKHRLRQLAEATAGSEAGERPSAQELQAALLDEVHTFMGDAPQFDDITLVIVTRELSG